MRILMVLLVATALFSCDKTELENNGIVGNWELRKAEGGIAPLILYQPGNGNILKFKGDGTYKKLHNGSVYESGTYTLEPSTVADQWTLTTTSATGEIITTETKIEASQIVILKRFQCCDFPDMSYERI